ncbi:MAG TPA: ROK family protein, partial [Gemmatimonadales bacterium]|nr:ROK family protein [Gemmatimonadales bacterium]
MRALGLDLGGTKLLACLIDAEGSILGRAVRSTGRSTGPLEARRLIGEAATELRDTVGSFEVAGLGFPGLVDYGAGVARASVMLDGWRDVPLAEQLAHELGVSCVVDNDVNAAAVAELRCRADDPPGSMLFVAVGTGIGGALVFDNRLWRGHTGVAGEIGNMTIDRHGPVCWCGRRGCLNTSASGSAMERLLQEKARPADRSPAAGPAPDEILEEAATALGIGLANALNLLNPALVALGGGVARLGQRWLDTVAATARAEAFPEAGQCRIEA